MLKFHFARDESDCSDGSVCIGQGLIVIYGGNHLWIISLSLLGPVTKFQCTNALDNCAAVVFLIAKGAKILAEAITISWRVKKNSLLGGRQP